MTEWALIGGPLTEQGGSGKVPDGYEYEGPGSSFGPTYDPALRTADSVYRWSEDVLYIRDGERLLSAIEKGEIQFAMSPELADAVRAAGSIGLLREAIYTIKDVPESDIAQGARETIDSYRQRGVI